MVAIFYGLVEEIGMSSLFGEDELMPFVTYGWWGTLLIFHSFFLDSWRHKWLL
jgi:hypothetical protein